VTRDDRPPHVATVGSKCFIVIERIIVMRDSSLPMAMHHMFLLIYVLNLEYPVWKKRIVDYFTFVQKVLFELDRGKLPPKITTFLNDLARASAGCSITSAS